MWNPSYHRLFNKAKSLMKGDACIKFYDQLKPMSIETDASGVGLGVSLLQTREGTSCPSEKAPDNNMLIPTAFVSKTL